MVDFKATNSYFSSLGITDSQGYLFVIRHGPPSDTAGQKTWCQSMEALKEAMNQARDSLHLSEKDINHHRGYYECISAGISYGGGQEVSKCLYILSFHIK